MSDPVPDRIAVTFSMTADDYARYIAATGRQGSSHANTVAYAAVFFCAIPVALAFRHFAGQLSDDARAGDLVGKFSLAAFLLGTLALVAAIIVMRRMAMKSFVAGTLNAFEAKTAVFDRTGVTLIGQLSQSSWRWAAISRFTNEDGLFLIWIGQTMAAVIPARSFGGDDACAAAAAFIRARLSKAASAGDVGER